MINRIDIRGDLMGRLFFISLVLTSFSFAERAREWGLPFEGKPGRLNAITDVPGVEVGQVTLIQGTDVRTGVTAILPTGKKDPHPVPGSWFTLNGNGELTGTTWLDESGFLEAPITFTNTHSVGVVRDAVVEWGNKKIPDTEDFSLPVVGETWDGFLNDTNGHFVKKEHVFQALNSASSGQVAEGGVGGGTGMVLFRFKGGIGTSSRQISDGKYRVGVLVQANFGERQDLTIHGVRVGKAIADLLPEEKKSIPKKDGSILVAVATDMPLLPHQLKRVAKHVSIGIGRTGGLGRNSSGDIFVAFSTAVPKTKKDGTQEWKGMKNDRLDDIFEGVVQATEEAIFNALFAGETMSGLKGNKVYGFPKDRLSAIIKPSKP